MEFDSGGRSDPRNTLEKTMSMKTLICSAALIAGMTSIAPAATAADWSLSTDFVGEYVFRGTTLGAESLQAGVEVAFDNGFYTGIWGNTGVGEQSSATDDEIDFYAGYGFELSPTISADVGATLYHYPQSGDIFDIGTGAGDASTLEFFGGLGFDVALAPSIYVYYDETLETFTVEGGAEYSVPVSDTTSFDLSGSLGAVEPDSGTDYQYLTVGAALSYAFSDAASGYIGLNAGTSSEDTYQDIDVPAGSTSFGPADDSSVWYSIGLSTGF